MRECVYARIFMGEFCCSLFKTPRHIFLFIYFDRHQGTLIVVLKLHIFFISRELLASLRHLFTRLWLAIFQRRRDESIKRHSRARVPGI
jgi:hypothetical protein